MLPLYLPALSFLFVVGPGPTEMGARAWAQTPLAQRILKMKEIRSGMKWGPVSVQQLRLAAPRGVPGPYHLQYFTGASGNLVVLYLGRIFDVPGLLGAVMGSSTRGYLKKHITSKNNGPPYLSSIVLFSGSPPLP